MAEPPPPLLIPITDRAAFLARVHIAVTIPLLAITLIPFSARLYVRIWPIWRVGWDDALIVAGFACAIADWALLEGEMFLHPQYITIEESITAIRLSYFGIFLWLLAMTSIKTSVALTLLRIPLDHRAWRPFLYTILAVQTTYCIGDTIYIFAKCRPLQAAWDYTILGAQCTDIPTDVLVSSIGSALNIATDISLSLAPMLILWQLRRPRKERILVCFLTGIGLFASGSSVAKAVMVGRWGKTEDPWALAMTIATWTIAEQFLAVLAACSPSLKGPIEHLLGKFGILLTGPGSNFSFMNIVRTRSGRERAAARRREALEEAEGGIMMDRGRSGPVQFHVREGEEIEEKTNRPLRSKRHGGRSDAGRRSNVIPV